MPGKEFFGIQRGHAAHSGAGDGLAVDVVGQVAGREDAGDGGAGGAGLDLHIAAVVQLQLVLHQFGRGGMADGDEEARAGDVGDRAGQDVAGADGLDAARARAGPALR